MPHSGGSLIPDLHFRHKGIDDDSTDVVSGAKGLIETPQWEAMKRAHKG